MFNELARCIWSFYIYTYAVYIDIKYIDIKKENDIL